MAELLHHRTTPTTNAQTPCSPNEVLQQVNMEDEFAAEIALLKTQMAEPRKEAVELLLQFIQQQAATIPH